MKLYELVNFITLWTIGMISAGIAYEFHKSQDGRLRVLIRRFFIVMVWVYNGAAILYSLFDPITFVYIRLFLITPLVVVMLQLWGYMRKRN